MKPYLFSFLMLVLGHAMQAQQINQHNIDQLISFVDSTGANEMRLFHDNTLIGSYSNDTCTRKMNTASMVKSWTSLVIGALIDDGKIGSVDDLACTYIPDWQGGCDQNIKISHLLTMSAGIGKKRARESVLAQDDHNLFVKNVIPENEPGSKFSYSNESCQLLGIVIENASGMNAQEAFDTYLFNPLGISDTQLARDKEGKYLVYGGALTSVETAATIGKMIMNQGLFNGTRVISEDWVTQLSTPSSTNSYYSYLWWVDTANGNIAAMGDFGQMTIIFPEKKLVFVRQQSCNNNDPRKNMKWMGIPFIQMIANTVN